MDDHVYSPCPSHDSRRWVRFAFSVDRYVKETMADLYSFFYSGLARRKSALSLIWLSVMATAVVTFQWFFWGYSLTFSHQSGSFMGALDNFGFRNVLAQPSVASSRVPDLLYALYQGMFAGITYVNYAQPRLAHS